MFKPIIRMAAAALVAGVIAFAITAAPAGNDGAAKPTLPQPFANGRSPSRPGQGARMLETRLAERRAEMPIRSQEPAGEARTVRVIALR